MHKRCVICMSLENIVLSEKKIVTRAYILCASLTARNWRKQMCRHRKHGGCWNGVDRGASRWQRRWSFSVTLVMMHNSEHTSTHSRKKLEQSGARLLSIDERWPTKRHLNHHARLPPSSLQNFKYFKSVNTGMGLRRAESPFFGNRPANRGIFLTQKALEMTCLKEGT